jgi:hypothetical protein
MAFGLAAGMLALIPQDVPAQQLPRSSVDRADEQLGAQIHVLYVLPSDGGDRGLDTDGTIAKSVANFRGSLDVTFVRLGQTDKQLAANGVFIRDVIERELKGVGFSAPDKLYAVYYDGSSTAACGGGAWPPVLPGNVGAVYLRGTFGAGFPCYDPTLSRTGLQIMDFAVLHELLHTMGLVAACAPHHTRSGHVSDSPADLMYAGDQPWHPAVLDVGHDDYFDTGGGSCLDLARSNYLESAVPPPPSRFTLSVVVRGPGRVTTSPAAISCPGRCSAIFDEGTRVGLRAVPRPGARFRGWSGACRGSRRCAVTMDGPRRVVALFRR